MGWVSWKYSEENVAAGKKVNVAVAAYISTQARLKQHEFLSTLRQDVLYCDTDSAIFVQKDNDLPKVKTEDYRGDLTDELEEYGSDSYIHDFVSGIPKKFAF